ncbi:MAG: hypothetical protein IT323_13650 [Anaerolineae bacterium]|nr:hypothetical protein [Anaerolineae bacterium]
MNLQQAQEIVSSLIVCLAPACEQISVAGSVRRQKADVKDIEIVCLPIYEAEPQAGLFAGVDFPDEPADRYALKLEDTLSRMRANGVLAFDPHVKRNGDRYKRFVVNMPRERLPALHIALDLFIADRGNFGNTLAIRTGDAEFSHLLVTPRRLGGLMPGNMRQRDGYLWAGDERVDCKTERDYFGVLGLTWVEPQFRNKTTAIKLARGLVRA